MKINLDIKEDKELRKEVRKMIEGAVTSIVREEIRKIIIDVMAGENNRFTSARLEQLAQQEISSHVRAFVNKDVSFLNNDYKILESIVRQEVKKHLEKKEDAFELAVKKSANDLTEESLRKIVEKEVENSVTRKLKNLLSK